MLNSRHDPVKIVSDLSSIILLDIKDGKSFDNDFILWYDVTGG